MRRSLSVFLVLLVVSLATGSRDMQAGPINEVDDTFYDCSMNELGWRLLSCGGHVYTSGQQSGGYRQRSLMNCESGGGSVNWY